nr:hypothetical protein [Polyangium aurulentum]
MLDERSPVGEERHRGRVESHPLDRSIVNEALAPKAFAGGAQPCLFAWIDAVEGALIRARAARADLDDRDHGPVARDEIDLGPAHPHISANDCKP